MKKAILFSCITVLLVSGCTDYSYDNFSFPEQEEGSLIKTGDLRTGSDYRNMPPVREETLETFASSDRVCVVDKKADYLDVYLDVKKSGHYRAGEAYCEALMKVMPDFSERMDQFIFDELSASYNNNDYTDFSDAEERITAYEKNLDEKYLQELKGFCNGIGDVSSGIVNDGKLSYEELIALSIADDLIFRWQTGSTLAVCGEKSATGYPLTVTTFDRLGNDLAQLSGFCTVLHIIDGDDEIIMPTLAGSFSSETMFSSRGLSAAMHQRIMGRNSLSADEAERSLVFAMRKAMENNNNAEDAAKEIAETESSETANIIFTDRESCVSVGAHHGNNNIRHMDTELFEGIEWAHPDCMCISDSDIINDTDNSHMISFHTLAGIIKYNIFLDEYEKLTADDMRSLITSDKVNNDNSFSGLRNLYNRELIVFDSSNGSITAAFTGEEGVSDIPDFLEIGGVYDE